MLKPLLVVILLIWIGLMPSGEASVAMTADRHLEIDVNRRAGTLSVHARNVPLIEVLMTIGDGAGFQLKLLGAREFIVTQHFSNIPLAEGIRRLVGNHSVAIIYQIVDAPDDRKELQDIKEIWIFDSANKTPASAYSNGQNEFSKTGETTASPAELNPYGKIEPVGLADSPIDLGERHPLQPDAYEIEKTVADAQFDNENVAYWAGQLINNADRSSREQAITELKRIGNDAAAAAIASAFADDDAHLRRHAVESLGGIDSSKAVQLIGQALLGDKDPSVRLSAVRFFSSQNSVASRAFLNSALKDSDVRVKSQAKQALSKY